MGTPPRVLVSYAWDAADDAWVETFATRLRTDFVDAQLDRWLVHPGEDLTKFMETQVRDSVFVLFICTPKYKAKADKRTGGVGYETMIATAEVLSLQDDVARKFIPVHRSGAWADASPSWLLGRYRIDLTGDPYSEANYQDLLNTLLDRRKGPPPIGGGAPTTPAAGPSPAATPPRAPGPSASGRAGLSKLLLDLYSSSELHRFVAYLPGGDDLTHQLPTGAAPATYVHELVGLLHRRGHIDVALFDTLVRERPRRENEIRTVQRECGL